MQLGHASRNSRVRRTFLSIFLFCLIASRIWGTTDPFECKQWHECAPAFNKASCEHYLSICAVFQDEARWLKEWLEFHQMVGVEHFYLFNNNSTDNYADVLRPYIDRGIVDLFEWPSPEEEVFYTTQVEVYNHCIELCVGHTQWLAIIDIDEFLCPVSTPDLPSFLKQHESRRGLGGIMVFWQMYGTSWIPRLRDDELLTEHMVFKLPTYDGRNHQVKTICKPQTVSRYDVHGAHYKTGFWDMTTNGHGGPHQPTQINQLRINHYWTRDDDFLVNIKKPRREKYEGGQWSDETLNRHRHEYNQHEDRFMDRFVPRLKERIFGSK